MSPKLRFRFHDAALIAGTFLETGEGMARDKGVGFLVQKEALDNACLVSGGLGTQGPQVGNPGDAIQAEA